MNREHLLLLKGKVEEILESTVISNCGVGGERRRENERE